MDAHFWHEKWQNREIGFHEGSPNSLLVKHFNDLELEPSATVFVPLCGKTKDIAWLLEKGINVTGVELNETAIRELFTELGLEPYITEANGLVRYSAPQITIFVGDIFKLTKQQINDTDAIYDRAALVALPTKLREKYTQHLASITQSAKQLVIVFDYDQQQMDGPPFAISDDTIKSYYASNYQLSKLDSKGVDGGLKGAVPATEIAWLLK